MRLWKTTQMLVAGALLGAAGPVAPQAATAQDGGYFADRGNDFRDMFRIRAGVPRVGNGYGAKVRATALAQLGYVHFNGDYAGIDKRAIGKARVRRTEGGVSLLYASQHQTAYRAGNYFTQDDTNWATV